MTETQTVLRRRYPLRTPVPATRVPVGAGVGRDRHAPARHDRRPRRASGSGFNILSGGDFLTARNLWNLSVQSASIAIMATGMVLIIVSRNIDLSVGSLLGFLGYTMAMVQTQWIPDTFDLGFDQLVHVDRRARRRRRCSAPSSALFQGFIVAYVGVPSFIVTLGGFLIWRGLIFRYAQGQTLAPLDATFQLLGGGPTGSLGEWRAGCSAAIGCALHRLQRRRSPGAAVSATTSRSGRRRRRHRASASLGCAVVLGAVWVANSYYWPEQLASQYAADHGITEPEGGLQIPTGIAYPVVILIGGDARDDLPRAPSAVRSLRLRHRRQPRGGRARRHQRPRTIIMLTFVLMGVLVRGQRRGPDGPPQRRGHQPRRAERARRDLGGGHRRHVVRRRRRHDPRRRARRGDHAVAAVGHGAAQGRLADAGHRGRASCSSPPSASTRRCARRKV